MIIKIDFNSEEALYMQITNQIIMGIAMDYYHEGDQLPSIRSMADKIGINMHTVNKAYSVLKQEGFVKVDRRRGVVISRDIDKLEALAKLKGELEVFLAKAQCKGITKNEVHKLVEDFYNRNIE